MDGSFDDHLSVDPAATVGDQCFGFAVSRIAIHKVNGEARTEEESYFSSLLPP